MIITFTLLVGIAIGSVVTAAWFGRKGKRISSRFSGKRKGAITVSANGSLTDLDEYEVELGQ